MAGATSVAFGGVVGSGAGGMVGSWGQALFDHNRNKLKDHSVAGGVPGPGRHRATLAAVRSRPQPAAARRIDLAT